MACSAALSCTDNARDRQRCVHGSRMRLAVLRTTAGVDEDPALRTVDRRAPPIRCCRTWIVSSGREKIGERIDRGRSQALVVEAYLEYFALARRRETAPDVRLEFLHEQRNAFCTPARMPDRKFDFGTRALSAVFVEDLDGIGIGADRTVAQCSGVPRIFLDSHERAQFVDARVACEFVAVVVRREPAMQQGHRDCIL